MRTRTTLITIVLLACVMVLLVVGSVAARPLTLATFEPDPAVQVSAPYLKSTALAIASPIISWEYDQIQPAIAYNSQTDQHLVVWEDHHWGWGNDWDIYGRFVGIDGAPLGSHFAISWEGDKHRLAPDVAYNHTNSEFLVVWEYEYSPDDHDIFARRVGTDGTPISGEILITNLTNFESNPTVAYNPANNEYLIVWEHLFEGRRHGIYGRRVAANGTLLGESIPIDPSSPWLSALMVAYDALAPAVAYGSVNGQYLVVWQDKYPEKVDYDITGRRVGNDGSLVGGEIAISTWEYDQVKPRLAFNSAANEFLVVWEDHHWGWGEDWDIYGQRVHAGGTLVGGNFGISWEGANHRESPAVAYKPAANEYLVAWEYEYNPADHDVYRRRVGSDGALPEVEAGVSSLGSWEGRPALASDANWAYLVVWEDGRDAATQGMNIYGDLVSLAVLSGRVYAGNVEDESTSLGGVTVELYCSNNASDLGTPIGSTTTNAEGWYGLLVAGVCEFYNIVETDLPGYESVGATSVGGTVINSNWIQYTHPLEGKTLTGNKFWDRRIPTPTLTNTPTATATRTPTRTATPTNTPTATATRTPTPSPTSTATPSPTATTIPTLTPTPTATATPTATRTPTATHTATPTATATRTPTPSPTSTATPSPTATATPTLTPTPTATATPTATRTPTATHTATPTATLTPTPTTTLGAICSLEDVSPGPGSTPQPVWWNASLWGKMLSLSITGVQGAIGPATSWMTFNDSVLVEHVAAADQNGNLIVFYAYPDSDWKAVNISEKTGKTIAIERPESWVFTEAEGPFEKLAAPAPNGDLLVFSWRSETDWQVTNVSSAMGPKIIGPMTSWVTPPGNVEHLAARGTNNDLLVFYRAAGGSWQVVNVTAITGQKVGGPATSWMVDTGTELLEKVAAPAPNGDLILFTYRPSTNWQATNLTQVTGQAVSGPAIAWLGPGPVAAEQLAAPAPNSDLIIFYTDPIEGGWHVLNVTTITGQKVAGPATVWLTPLSPQGGFVEHMAAPGPNQHLYVFYKATGGNWQVVDVTNLTGKTITHTPTSWVAAKGSVLAERLAAPSFDGHLYLFHWDPGQDWTVYDVSLKASGRTVYAAAELAGVWRSRDYGMTWAQMTRPQPVQGAQTIGGLNVPEVRDVAVSPADPRLVLAATGGDHRNTSRTGIYRSTDGGETWTRVHQFFCGNQVQPATQVIFAPGEPTKLYGAGGCNVVISTDSGLTWTPVFTTTTTARVWHVAVSPLLPGDVRRAFACGSGNLWYSPDSGQHWYRDQGTSQSLPPGFCAETTTGNGDAAQTLALEPGKPDHVYLAYQHNANGPSYFHPSEAGPDGAHCNNPVVYDNNNNGTYDAGELHIWGLAATVGATLKDDPKLMYVDANSNNVLDGNEAVVHDTNGDGVYTSKNEPVLRGTAPSVGTALKDDPKIKHVDLGTPFGPRGCGEGSLWYGDLSSFDPTRPSDLRGSWSQLPGPPVYPNGDSGGAFVYTHPTQDSYLVFFSDQGTLHVSVGKPTEGSWHRLDGWDASESKRQNKYNITLVHVDPHGLAISPDFDLTLKPVRDQQSPYNLNKELDKCKGGRLWMCNDGGVYRSDDCGQTWIPTQAGLSTLAAINVAGVARLTTEPGRPNPPPALYSGTGDNDDFYTLDGGATWRSPISVCGDCNTWYTDPSQPNRVFRQDRTVNGAFDVFVNPGGGYPDALDQSQLTTVPTPPGGRLIWEPGHRPIIQTLANETPLSNGDYIQIWEIGSRRVLMRAQDSIKTSSPWVQVGLDLPAGVYMAQAAGGHFTPTYYVGDGTRLWVSRPNQQGNIEWQQIVPRGDATVAQKFFVNPYNANEIYIVDNNAVRHSTDGGITWPPDTLLDSALTAGGEFRYDCGQGWLGFHWCILNDLIFDRESPQTRFAVGLAGVFYSGDSAHWFRLVDTRALPSRPVGAYFNPITDPNDRSLYIAFLGRGIMRCHPIPAQPPPPLPTPTPGPSPTPIPTPTPTPSTPGQSLITNGGFETGELAPWAVFGAAQVVDEHAHSGRYSLRMGTQNDSIDQASQEAMLPDNAWGVTLSYWWYIDTEDIWPVGADKLQVLVQWEGGSATLEALTNSDPRFQWRQSWFDLSAYRGQGVTLTFRAEENSSRPTVFYLDDIRLDAHYRQVYLPTILKSYP